MTGDGRGAREWPARLRPRARFAAVGVTGVAIGVLLVLSVLAPVSTSHMGPFILNSSNPTVSLSFPECAVVTVHWTVVVGPQVNFSVGSGEVVLASDCHGPPPTNASCVEPYCGGVSMAPGPICFEQGYGGTCSFTATQPMYGFGAVAYPYSIGNATVSFTISYVRAMP